MPRYRVEALEKFIVRTVYHVEADSETEAEQQCKSGSVGYESAEIEEGDEDWMRTVAIENMDDEDELQPIPVATPQPPNFVTKHGEGLFMYLDEQGHEQVVEYLLHFQRGVYSYSPYGQVKHHDGRDITPDEVDKHNFLLDEAIVIGLGKCQVGQCGILYLRRLPTHSDTDDKSKQYYQVTTFRGRVLANNINTSASDDNLVRVHGNTIVFHHRMDDGAIGVFRGQLDPDADCFNFERIS